MPMMKPITRTRRIVVLTLGGVFLVTAIGLQGVKSSSEERKRSLQSEADQDYRRRLSRINREVESIPPWMRDGCEGVPERVSAGARRVMASTQAEMDAVETEMWVGPVQIGLVCCGLMSLLALFAPRKEEEGRGPA